MNVRVRAVCGDAVPTVTLAPRWSLVSTCVHLQCQADFSRELGRVPQLGREDLPLDSSGPGKVLASVGDW